MSTGFWIQMKYLISLLILKSDFIYLGFMTLLVKCKICSCNHLVTMATYICASFLLFKEWKQFIVKIVLLLSLMWRHNHAHLKCRILWGCLVWYSTQQTADIWRQCMKDIKKSTCDHYASLTFWHFHLLSSSPRFTVNMIYRKCLLWHDELSHHWRLEAESLTHQ